MTSDLTTQIVVALIAVLKVVELLLARWKAGRDFDIARGQNQALSDLKEQRGVTTLAPPPVRRRQRRGSGLVPRAPTPLPFWPVKPGDKDNPGGKP